MLVFAPTVIVRSHRAVRRRPHRGPRDRAPPPRSRRRRDGRRRRRRSPARGRRGHRWPCGPIYPCGSERPPSDVGPRRSSTTRAPRAAPVDAHRVAVTRRDHDTDLRPPVGTGPPKLASSWWSSPPPSTHGSASTPRASAARVRSGSRGMRDESTSTATPAAAVIVSSSSTSPSETRSSTWRHARQRRRPDSGRRPGPMHGNRSGNESTPATRTRDLRPRIDGPLTASLSPDDRNRRDASRAAPPWCREPSRSRRSHRWRRDLRRPRARPSPAAGRGYPSSMSSNTDRCRRRASEGDDDPTPAAPIAATSAAPGRWRDDRRRTGGPFETEVSVLHHRVRTHDEVGTDGQCGRVVAGPDHHRNRRRVPAGGAPVRRRGGGRG